MIARFDHRPMLTALLALATAVLVVVVIMLTTLLITSASPAASPASTSSGSNPAAPAPKVMDAGSYGEVYGYDMDQPKSGQTGHPPATDRHADVVAAYHNAE